MRRRDFVALGAAALALPRIARAQNVTKRVAALIGGRAEDRVAQSFVEAVRLGLRDQGWTEGLNLMMDVRFNNADPALSRVLAAELMELHPDAVMCSATAPSVAMRELTQTIPIVFVSVLDPIAAGLVDNFARPGGNVTGFTNFELSHVGKALELLLQVAPTVTRASMMFNPVLMAQTGSIIVPAFEAAATALGVEPLITHVTTVAEIEPAVAALAATPGTGIVVPSDNFMFSNRAPILAAINGHRLPAVYPFQDFANEGGAVAYGINGPVLFRQGGNYVGRILNGEDPAELPVQAPTSFLLVINLRTAREQGLVVPVSLLAVADRVIE